MSKDRQFVSLIDVLQHHLNQQPDKTAYIFLNDGEKDEIKMTYRELDRQARSIAAALQAQCRPGDRALLLYTPGLEFISAFIGCLYAGVMAVPVYPPNPASLEVSMEKFMAIFSDAKPSAVLTTEIILGMLDFLKGDYPEIGKIDWIASDKVESNTLKEFNPLAIKKSTTAFLQYTSGSTGNPKGVMVSHGNILYNEEMIKNGFGHSEDTVFVGWLPVFHDMGLIGNVLQPLYLGILCVLMSPVHFLKKPFRWLDAISRYKATTSGSPNFGYELCTRKITDEQLKTLDLRSWKVAYNGAEPVRAETLKNFTDKFKACGFREKSLYPCYGMAEATLYISGGIPSLKPTIENIDKTLMDQNKISVKKRKGKTTQKLVGCGKTWLDQEICIVDPTSKTLCPEDTVGEIWVSGDNVAQGYWKDPKKTKETFHAYLQDTGQGPFLRTGDLGFMVNDELFVNGRLKDLIIVRGRNLYPHDIEDIVCRSHPSLRPGCCAAFSIEKENEEKLIIVQEARNTHLPDLNTDDVINQIIKEISKYYEISAHTVTLIKQGTLPKTSSGKVQRNRCRTMFLEDTLDTVAEKCLQPQTFKGVTMNNPPKPDFESVESIEDWLAFQVSRYASVDSEVIEFSNSVFDYGLDSKQIISLNVDVEETFGGEVSPTLFIDNPTISGIASHLVDEFLDNQKIPSKPKTDLK